MRATVAYLVAQVAILLFLAATAPQVIGVAILMGVVIYVAFYVLSKWIGLGERPRAPAKEEREP